MIEIINYGAGNIASIKNIIEKVGGSARVVSDPEDFKGDSKIILPGVGAFDNAMRKIHSNGWYEKLNKAVTLKKTPILGVCLGMHLMCNSSEEGGLPGFGWFDASVYKFSEESGEKIPHMGWNAVMPTRENSGPSLFPGDKHRFYFVHSYYVTCHNDADILAETTYGTKFTCAIQKENMFAVQFHPEKSHKYGYEFFLGFVNI